MAILAFDASLYFFSMPVSFTSTDHNIDLECPQAGTTEANMLVVSDVDDVFLPKPNDLLVNLTESRASIESLLGRLHEMFQDNHVVGSALGPALQAGLKLMVCFQFTRF